MLFLANLGKNGKVGGGMCSRSLQQSLHQRALVFFAVGVSL